MILSNLSVKLHEVKVLKVHAKKIPDLSEKNKIFIYTQIKVLDALTCTMLVFGTTDDKSNISSYFFCKFAEFIINGPNNMTYVYFFSS